MKKFAFAVVCAISAAGSINAATIPSSVNGWFNADGEHYVGNTNTFTGLSGGTEYRSFYVFDLTNAAPASAISISFNAGNGSYYPNGGSESIALYDYTGPVSTLTADGNGASGVAAFVDLGSGVQLGTYTINGSNPSAMPGFTINLSQAFVDQYNAAIASSATSIALGAALTSINGADEQAFWSGSSTQPAASIDVTAAAVPEPASWAMMIGGFGLVGATMRRKKAVVSFG